MMHPKRQPSATHRVVTADGIHTLHVREYGDRQHARAGTVVYLHGGPGGGSPPDTARLFDPEAFHVITFDQRGCGLSECEDRLRSNTLDLLVQDVETIREALAIDKWGVMGSSYGSLLTVLYAARHAARVSWALLHGVFLGSRAEIAWLYEEGGASRFYPQQWEDFQACSQSSQVEENGMSGASACSTMQPKAVAHVDGKWCDESGAHPFPILESYHSRLTRHPAIQPSLRANPLPADGVTADGPPPAEVLRAAEALVKFEDEMETLAPMPATHEVGELVSGAQIAAHHFYHGCFLPEAGCVSELSAGREALAGIPCRIIHGRHDVVCTPRAAYRVQALWPHSQLRIVESGAHALFEKPMRAAAQACLAELTQFAGGAGGIKTCASNTSSKRKR